MNETSRQIFRIAMGIESAIGIALLIMFLVGWAGVVDPTGLIYNGLFLAFFGAGLAVMSSLLVTMFVLENYNLSESGGTR